MSHPGVQALLESALISIPTKEVLSGRLHTPKKDQPDFFSESVFRVLIAVSDRLFPQADLNYKIDLPGMLDTTLLEGKGNGWRYDKLPADGECFTLGLQLIDKEAQDRFGQGFDGLDEVAQEAILQSVQQGKVEWNNPEPALFFEELLITLTELYYSHPYGRMEMGDGSMADVKGWQL